MRTIRVIALVLIPVAHLFAQERTSMVGLDHIILATADLSKGSEEFARLTGVTPRFGGQHPGRGTQNALASLGSGQYLEVLAPVVSVPDPSLVPLVPRGWALHTVDLPAVIQKLKASGFSVVGPVPGSRMTPDSALLQWRTASVSGPGLELAPFFIEWGTGTPHPSTTTPGGCRLTSFELAAPDTSALHDLFVALGYTATLRVGASGAMRLSLTCPRGPVHFVSG